MWPSNGFALLPLRLWFTPSWSLGTLGYVSPLPGSGHLCIQSLSSVVAITTTLFMQEILSQDCLRVCSFIPELIRWLRQLEVVLINGLENPTLILYAVETQRMIIMRLTLVELIFYLDKALAKWAGIEAKVSTCRRHSPSNLVTPLLSPARYVYPGGNHLKILPTPAPSLHTVGTSLRGVNLYL